MLSGSRARGILIAAALLLALGVLFYPTDEKRVRAVADALIAAANAGPAELARALDEHAVADVRIDVAELSEPLTGRAALVGALRDVSSAEPLHYRLENVEIAVSGKRARLSADLITMPHAEVPELRRPRHGTAIFERRTGQFRLISAEIGAERLDQPEARP